MSKLGIGLLYFALAGALIAAYFGFSIIGKYSNAQTTITQTQQSLTTEKKAVTEANKKTDEAVKAKEDVDAQLTTVQATADDAKAKLATAEKAQEDLNASLQQAKTDADKAKTDLQHVNDVLGMTPEEAKAASAKAQSDLTAAQSQQKILQDQLQASQKQIADLQDAINRSKTGQMPGVSGKITFVNRAWNFVVLNVGISNGVVPNGELIVYRGRNFLGKVKVTSAEAGTSVADILPNAKGDIQVGDDVLN